MIYERAFSWEGEEDGERKLKGEGECRASDIWNRVGKDSGHAVVRPWSRPKSSRELPCWDLRIGSMLKSPGIHETHIAVFIAVDDDWLRSWLLFNTQTVLVGEHRLLCSYQYRLSGVLSKLWLSGSPANFMDCCTLLHHDSLQCSSMEC